MSTIEIAGGQTKWKIVAVDNGRRGEFGPYDTPDRAKTFRDQLAKLGVDAKVETMWTCSSLAIFARDVEARNKVAAVAAAAKAAEDAKNEPAKTEDAPTDEQVAEVVAILDGKTDGDTAKDADETVVDEPAKPAEAEVAQPEVAAPRPARKRTARRQETAQV